MRGGHKGRDSRCYFNQFTIFLISARKKIGATYHEYEYGHEPDPIQSSSHHRYMPAYLPAVKAKHASHPNPGFGCPAGIPTGS
jgi:hypothetical protein